MVAAPVPLQAGPMDALSAFLARAVMVVHFGFLLFVPLGGFLTWRWRRALYPHLFALAWSVGIVSFRYDCPLTPLEQYLLRAGTGQSYSGGFIDHYVEGVIYPVSWAPAVSALLAATVAASYALRPRRPQAGASPLPG